MKGKYEEKKSGKIKYTLPINVAILAVVVGFAPFIPVIIAIAIAGLTGCNTDSYQDLRCGFLGMDVHPFINFLSALGGFLMASIPAGGFGLVIAVLMAVGIAINNMFSKH